MVRQPGQISISSQNTHRPQAFAAFFVAISFIDKNLSTNLCCVDNFPFATAINRAKTRIFVA
jgi:hypothetical protein